MEHQPVRPPVDPAEKLEMARKLMEDPAVARKVISTPGKAGNIVEQEVERKQANDRKRPRSRARRTRPARGAPDHRVRAADHQPSDRDRWGGCDERAALRGDAARRA